jgi:hypothetical protein
MEDQVLDMLPLDRERIRAIRGGHLGGFLYCYILDIDRRHGSPTRGSPVSI